MCHIFIVCSFGSRNTLQCYERGCVSQKHSDLQYLSWELYLCLLPFLLSSCFGLWSQRPLTVYGFWTPAEFVWWKGLWRNEGMQGLILARAFCAVCLLVFLSSSLLFSWCKSWILFLIYETSKHLAVARECELLWLLHFLKPPFCKQFLGFCVWFSFKYFTVKIISQVFSKGSKIRQYLFDIDGNKRYLLNFKWSASHLFTPKSIWLLFFQTRAVRLKLTEPLDTLK